MLSVFVAALVIGLGTLLVQLLGGHDAGGHDAGGHDAGGHDGPLFFLASIRFWAFALLAFGLVGTMLLGFGFAGKLEAAIISSVAGLASGFVAHTVVRRLQQGPGTSSAATGKDVIGQVGRVIVPPSNESRGKVRVSVRGSFVDYVARSTETLEADEAVVVEEFESGEVVVSRAPKELTP